MLNTRARFILIAASIMAVPFAGAQPGEAKSCSSYRIYSQIDTHQAAAINFFRRGLYKNAIVEIDRAIRPIRDLTPPGVNDDSMFIYGKSLSLEKKGKYRTSYLERAKFLAIKRKHFASVKNCEIGR